ncbi:TPA: hypothetical protein I0I20_RS09195 [Enterococcus faecium]
MSFCKMKINDIGYYAARVTVYCVDSNEREHYLIQGLMATKIRIYFQGKKKHYFKMEEVPLAELYPRIKHVYDHDGILIGRRNGRNQPLRITGKGMSKFLLYENRY